MTVTSAWSASCRRPPQRKERIETLSREHRRAWLRVEDHLSAKSELKLDLPRWVLDPTVEDHLSAKSELKLYSAML